MFKNTFLIRVIYTQLDWTNEGKKNTNIEQ